MIKLKDILNLVKPDMIYIHICDTNDVLIGMAPHEVRVLYPKWMIKDIQKELLNMEVIRIDPGNTLQIYVRKMEKEQREELKNGSK